MVKEEENPCHVVLDHHFRRRANHDGATFSLGALFYYFRLEDQVSENHLLRLIEKHIITVRPAVRRLIPSFCCASC